MPIANNTGILKRNADGRYRCSEIEECYDEVSPSDVFSESALADPT